MKKDMHVTDDTQLHMSTRYVRNQSGSKEKTTAKRTFSYVIQGMLIAATVVGSVVLPAGVMEASASTPVKEPLQVSQTQSFTATETAARKEAMQITNLKMANKVLSAALKSGQLDGYVYGNVTKRLTTIAEKIDQGVFEDTDSLAPVIQETGLLLRTMVDDTVGTDVLTKRAESLDILLQLESKLSSELPAGQYQAGDLGVAYAGKEKEFTVLLASKSAASPTVEINGTKMKFNNAPMVRDSTVLVPMRDIFQAFGAKVSWNAASQTITAVKDGSTIKLKLGSTQATIDGRAVTLTTPARSFDGVTMVPLRFVSEALNAKVSWNAAQNKVEIASSTTFTQPVFNGGTSGITQPPSTGNTGISNSYTANGIKVSYKGHTYGSDNQKQYDQVMSITSVAVKNSAGVSQYVKDYLNGERFDGDMGNDSDKNVALKQLDGRLKALVQAGVPRATIEKLVAGTTVANNLVKTAKDNGDSAAQYSAYHALVQKQTDCDSTAQVYLAILDQMGFSTGIYRTPGHADAVVNVPGYGHFLVTGGVFQKTDTPTALKGGKTLLVAFN